MGTDHEFFPVSVLRAGGGEKRGEDADVEQGRALHLLAVPAPAAEHIVRGDKRTPGDGLLQAAAEASPEEYPAHDDCRRDGQQEEERREEREAAVRRFRMDRRGVLFRIAQRGDMFPEENRQRFIRQTRGGGSDG